MILRIGRRAGIEPYIYYRRNPFHILAALAAFYDNIVHIWPVQVKIFWDCPCRFLELGNASYTDIMAIFIRPYGKRRSPVSFPRKGPVDIVFQPFTEPSVLYIIRIPVHFLIGFQKIILYLRCLYIPALLGIIHQPAVTSPAERIGVL